MHPLLARQLKRLGVDPPDGTGDAENWRAALNPFLELVSKAYIEADQDRYTLEKSLTVLSREMSDLHEGLHAAQAQLATKNEDLRQALALAHVTQEKLRLAATELEQRVADRTSELEAAQAQLVTSERLVAVGQLAAGVAHEVNNPLAYVTSNIVFAIRELSRLAGPSGGSFSDVIEALRQAREGATRIGQTTRDLRVFSRGQTDRREPVDLRRTIESCINMARNEIRHRARLVTDFGPTPIIEANEGRLAQVFLNLLFNAAQAVPDGAAEINQIRVETRTSEDTVIVEISDTGAGISPENMGRLFEPFFTTKPVGVGTGLGLSICHGIVKNLNGALEVESQVGVGSVFRVVLPIGNAASVAARKSRSHPIVGGRARVLVIDDDPMVLAAITRAIGGHDVTALSDAREALALVSRDGAFDLILCDLMMPNLSGIELHEMMATIAPRLRTRMVFLTGGAFTQRARDFLDQLPNRCLDKPFDPAGLRALVNSYAGRARAEAAVDREPVKAAGVGA